MYFFSNVQARDAPPCRVKEEGSGQVRRCALPFLYRGVLRRGCTSEGPLGGRRWCSTKTKVDEEEEGGGLPRHVPGGGHYGICPAECEGEVEA